jgi:hypothetical protein
MILDAVLLAVAKLSPTRKSGHDVAIFPEMRLTTGKGICVSHPVSKYEVWLTGNIDYGIIQYPAEHDNRGPSFQPMAVFVSPDVFSRKVTWR